MDQAMTAAERDRARAEQAQEWTNQWLTKARSMYDNLSASGAYDPEIQVGSLRRATQQANQDAIGAVTQNARAMGYRPGDSVTMDGLDNVLAKHALQFGQMAAQVRQEVPRQALSDWSLTRPELAQQAAQTAQQGIGTNVQAGMMAGQMYQPQGFDGFMQSLQPYLNKLMKPGATQAQMPRPLMQQVPNDAIDYGRMTNTASQLL